MLWQYQRCIVVGDEQLLIHIPRVVPLGQIVDALDFLDVNPRHTVQRPNGVAVVVGQQPQGLCNAMATAKIQTVKGLRVRALYEKMLLVP